MKLSRIRVRSFRSLFDFSANSKPFTLDLVDGMNLLIGPNNCGKSNVIRAVELALEPSATFEAAVDRPMNANRAQPTIQLDFEVSPDDPAADLVHKVQELRSRSASGEPKNDDGSISYRVRFIHDVDRAEDRRVADFGFEVDAADDELLQKTVTLFHEHVRFVITRSGESLKSVLEGRFRHVLRDVVKETLQQEYQNALERREGYLDDLQAALFEPLTAQVTSDLAAIFPEVRNVELRPMIPEIDATIANLAVSVADSAVTDLSSKGTGLRGGVIAAMLRYLALHSRHSMVFAVEEPEAFLHPGAQEGLRESLELLADRPEISVIATTHSPFMVPRRHDAKLIALTKDDRGATVIDAEARGDEPKASLIGGLFRDPKISYVLDSVNQVRPGADAVLVVEGETDVTFLDVAARLLRREDVLERFHLVAAGGATAAVVQALIMQAATERPVCALLDNDQIGRVSYDRLRDEAFSKLFDKKNVLSYRVAFKPPDPALPFEAEDLFSSELQLAFAARYPKGIVDVLEHAPGITHLEFPVALKPEFATFVSETATAADVMRFRPIFEALARRVASSPPSGRKDPPSQESNRQEQHQPAPDAPTRRSDAIPAPDSGRSSSPPVRPSQPPALEPAIVDIGDQAKPDRPRRPTPLESMLNAATPETKRLKEVLDGLAHAHGLEVETTSGGYSYRVGRKPVTLLSAQYSAVDVPLDHLGDQAKADVVARLVAMAMPTTTDKRKRQVPCRVIVDHVDWLIREVLEPRIALFAGATDGEGP